MASHLKPKVDSPEGKVAFGQVPYLHGAENTMQPSSSIALIVSIIVIKTMVLSSVFGGNFHHADGRVTKVPPVLRPYEEQSPGALGKQGSFFFLVAMKAT